MKFLHLPLLCFFFVFCSCSSSSPISDDILRIPSNVKFPSALTEILIRQLNLFPADAVAGKKDSGEALLVEKRFRFPNVAGDSASGLSVEDLGHHVGYYQLPRTHAARMFYFFFESRSSKDDPVVIWLSGGPGCSSEFAVFYENGPFTIANNMSLFWNDYGWDKASNLIYVDQPTGTGFSYSSDKRDLRHSENGVSDDLYDFLQEFMKAHPQYVKNDFYVTGESYAGHYIPAFASRIHRGNKDNEGIQINFKGFAIGNGLTDPAIQYRSYTDYALEMGLIQELDYKRINEFYPACESEIKLCGTDGIITCLASYLVCKPIINSIMWIAGKTNYYDIRKQCEGSVCYNFWNVKKFLNQISVRDALGVGDREFVMCSPTVKKAMLMDWMRNLEVGIPALLEDGIKLLVYAGEYDLISNWIGVSRWVHSMEWSGQKEFVESPDVPFMVGGSEAGLLKTHGVLSFMKVHDAGHMVAMDQPKAALEMFKRWTRWTLTHIDRREDETIAKI